MLTKTNKRIMSPVSLKRGEILYENEYVLKGEASALRVSKEVKEAKAAIWLKLYATYIQALVRVSGRSSSRNTLEMGKLKESQSNAKNSAIKSIIPGIPGPRRRSNRLIDSTQGPSSVPPKEGFFFLLLRWASHFYPFSNLKEAL